jgi:polyisoprenoid-binding protein YceI
MTRTLNAALVMAAVSAAPALADTWVVDKAHSEASFQVQHLMVSKVRGRFGDFAGTIQADAANPAASSVEFRIKTASIDTDDADRDKHLRSADFFDVAKHPEITFKSTKVTPRGDKRFDVTGTLTIRGVAKEVTLPVTYSGSVKDPWGNEKAGFETALTLSRKEYGLLWNKTLEAGGVVVGDEVQVTINLEALKQKAAAAN